MTYYDLYIKISLTIKKLEVKLIMDKAREVVGQILDFIENYIKLIKDLIEKFKSIGKKDAE